MAFKPPPIIHIDTTDNIFENKQPKLTEIPLKEDNNNTSLVEYKESFFTKFKKFIFRLLHI